MPSKFNPSSKLGQKHMQAAQRRRPGQSGSTSTGTAQSPSSPSQTRTATPGPEAGQSGRGQQSTRRGYPVTLSISNKGPTAQQVIYIHRAMREGLRSFIGTAREPEPNPETGSYEPFDYQTLNMLNMLSDEIEANAKKLHNASDAEKYDIVKIFDSTPRRLTPLGLTVIDWARERRPDLYKEYVDTTFLYFVTNCNKSEAGKERDVQERNDAHKAIGLRIAAEYEREKNAEQARSQYMNSISMR